MTDFTKINIETDVEGRDGPVQARFGRTLLETRELGVSLFRYGPGFKAPFGHHHKVQEEVYVVVSGSGRMKLGDEIVDVKPWDVIRVAPEVIRAFEGGPDGLELIVVGSERPPEGDGVKVDDFWP